MAPGGSYKFNFTWHAPSAPGDYNEFFGVVQEGVHWFSDTGEGRTAGQSIRGVDHGRRGRLSRRVRGAVVSSARTKGRSIIGVGQTVDGWMDLKNLGNKPWKAGETKLAPTPRDQPSAVAAADWLSPTRVSTLAADA